MQTIGIDVGKRQHIAAICHQGEREARKAVLRFSTDRAGLGQLEDWLARQGQITRAVLESSGHYHLNLAAALQRQGVPVAVVNPIESKYFGKRRLQRTTSDPADARTRALLAMVDQPEIRDVLTGAELREAARFAMALVDERGRVCQKITRLLELGFPELEQAYDDPTCTSALAVLRQAPTASAVARKRPATLALAARPGGGRAIGAKKAAQIQDLARATIAAPELAAQIGFQMRLRIAQYDLLTAQIAEAEAHLATLLDGELVRRLRTIPGVGPAICATLIAEIGDIRRFERFDQLVAYIGVHPAEKSSGQKGANPETSWRMSKAGNAYLRTALYQLAIVGIRHNPIIRAHYARKRAQGKSKVNAVGHCMKKGLAIVWGVWRSGEDFAAPETP
ncbi:MAG TPA: IS110 family transposase [Chloroflexi bacterium]|jgi:transposase|nr:IS110 family transposase [Chloroflexota bacterium]HAL28832.1 IS110 family transposase [Chloroflexota bacterium]